MPLKPKTRKRGRPKMDGRKKTGRPIKVGLKGRPRLTEKEKADRAEEKAKLKAAPIEKAERAIEIEKILDETIITEEEIDFEKVNRLREQISTVERDYGITLSKFLPHQEELKNKAKETVINTIDGNNIVVHKYKYVIFQAGNGAGKSYWLYKMVSLYAIGKNCADYGLEYIGEKKNIFIVTQSGSNVRDYVEKYLLGDHSPTRIPPDLIEKVIRGSDHIKEIRLKNGCVITIKTVEQGQKRLVGGNPDLLAIDEPIEKDDVWDELLARLRSPKAQMLYCFTPVNGYNKSYYFLYEQQDPMTMRRTYIGKFSSLLNTTQDHSTLNSFTPEERMVRIYGEFQPKSGLVYKEFKPGVNIIERMPVKDLGKCRYFLGIDVGVRHPTGMIAIAVDGDGRHIIFDEVKQSNLLVKDMSKKIKEMQKKHNIRFEKIIIDSAGQRERLELKEYGIQTENARKQEKGDGGEKNRRAGIMRVNQLFYDGMLLIFNTCTELIKELSVHSYKDGESAKDGEVNKVNDDVIDAMRYAIFFLKPPKVENEAKINFRRKFGEHGMKYSKGKVKRIVALD